jgi:branched-chain amino acid transport system ATP-binding protein
MLTIESMSVSYEGMRVLWDVSFHVKAKGITAIIGPNSAGKSTILNALAGIIFIDSGNILFSGKEINKYTPAMRVELGISLIPERRRLFPYLTVHENLELGAYPKRARASAKNNFEKIYQLFPILKKRNKQLAGTLSGGEQQMLAIARGLMSNPSLLMLDEPSIGLAPKITLELFRLIQEINNLGVTILICEQNIHHTLKLATEVFVLENGRIVMQGSGATLRNSDYIKKSYLGL